MGRAFALLGQLAYTQEWAAIRQILAPEICELFQKWDTLSPREQGEMAGYTIGKVGFDVFLTCAKCCTKDKKENYNR